jgi:predicted nucleotidyltransferase
MKEKLVFLNKLEKKIVMLFVKELKEKLGNDIITIRLFGSKVRGDFGKDSDIDIFILIKRKGDICIIP